jgi:hypothetical protein
MDLFTRSDMPLWNPHGEIDAYICESFITDLFFVESYSFYAVLSKVQC